MTLIATLNLHGYPILLGDLLLSQMGESKHHGVILTRTDVKNLLPEEWLRTITGVKRKVAKVNNCLAVGWTGRLIDARTLLKALRSQFESGPTSTEQLFSFLTDFEQLGNENFTLIGWLIEAGVPVSFKWDYKIGAIATGGDMYVPQFTEPLAVASGC